MKIILDALGEGFLDLFRLIAVVLIVGGGVMVYYGLGYILVWTGENVGKAAVFIFLGLIFVIPSSISAYRKGRR